MTWILPHTLSPALAGSRLGHHLHDQFDFDGGLAGEFGGATAIMKEENRMCDQGSRVISDKTSCILPLLHVTG